MALERTYHLQKVFPRVYKRGNKQAVNQWIKFSYSNLKYKTADTKTRALSLYVQKQAVNTYTK